jgi:hypothetical protein
MRVNGQINNSQPTGKWHSDHSSGVFSAKDDLTDLPSQLAANNARNCQTLDLPDVLAAWAAAAGP